MESTDIQGAIYPLSSGEEELPYDFEGSLQIAPEDVTQVTQLRWYYM